MSFPEACSLPPPPAFQLALTSVPPMYKCHVLILTSLMRTNGNETTAVNRITPKTASFHQKESKACKVLTVSFAKCLMGNAECISSKKSWKMFSKKIKLKKIIVGICPTQSRSKPTLATLFCHMQKKLLLQLSQAASY